jgi:nucleotide-binding universal stress UspA family protein
MPGSIICGMDDSESAKRAARVARALSAKLGLRLVFVRVAESGAEGARISAVCERLQELAAGVTEVDRGASWLVEVGRPADRLVSAAHDAAATMIVVGSTGPWSSARGSVSAEVSRRAPCPVVVVPPGSDHALARDQDNGNRDGDYAGGLVRLGFGASEGVSELAGGIARSASRTR